LAEAGLGKVGLEGALDYRGQTMPAQFLGTAAEFAGGGGFTGLVGKGIKKAATSDALVDAVQKLGGSGNFAKAEKAGSALERVGLGEGALKGAAIAGVGSEAAGQATEGTFLEPAARVIGALAAPSVANKTVNLFSQKAAARPTVENLKSYKKAAYNAADAAGVKFSPAEVDGFIKRASSQLDDVNFDPDVDLQTKASLAAITNKAGSELTLGQLDKMRQGLSRRYSRANNEVGILGMIDEIDNLIDSSQMGGELMKSARLANRKFKKAELLENALTKAEDQVASTGSGGNVVNKYKQAISNIINSKSARSFDADEIEVMRRFVRGDLPENALRLIGKLSPSGNGLMMALNIGAVATNPAMIGVTVAGAAAKAGSERLAKGSVEAIKDMIAGGSTPEARKLITDQQIRSLIGLQAE
jgi:hypothetical protein